MTDRDHTAAIEAKIAALRAAEDARLWRWHQGKADDAYRVDFDDRAWPELPLETWSSGAGDVWARRVFSFPEQIEGIPTRGATIELPLFVLVHSQVFVDGQERLAEPSWLDSRAVPLVLCESYCEGQTLQVSIHAFEGDGFGICIVSHVAVSSVEDRISRLATIKGQMAFARYLAFESEHSCDEWRALWATAADRLDIQALSTNDWTRWDASVGAARDTLSPLQSAAKEHTTHLVGHSHIDMNWLWPWRETVDVIRRDFEAMDGLMARFPDFRFSQSQASTYLVMQQEQPELFRRIQRRVAAGQWDVTASTWVEGDLNMQCGESLVRHFLLTRPYIEEAFGLRPKILWEPDTFGNVATLPQLMKQAGAEYYYFCRAGQGEPLFWWEGIDGSRVLAFNDFLGYNGVVEPEGVAAAGLALAQRRGIKSGLYLYGVGDHGGAATARDIEKARELDATPLLPQARMSGLPAFYESVASAKNLPTIHGELNTTFEGCYTTHADIKMANRTCENQLLSAETMATLAMVQADAQPPYQALEQAWKDTLFHHFHDILCGCSIGITYREAAEKTATILDAARDIRDTALAQLAAAVNTSDAGETACVVWNPLAWERTDLVRLPADAFGPTPTSLRDDLGHLYPVQICDDAMLFIARDVPALGCRTYEPCHEPAPSSVEATGPLSLTNGDLAFAVNPRSGAIASLRDLVNERSVDTSSNWHGVERKANAGYINRLQLLWEEPHPMSAWNIGDITRTENLISGAEVSLVESGPVRAVIEARQQFLSSSIVQRYCLYDGLDRIDVETDLDWHERGGKDTDAPMLRATFKPLLDDSKATFEVAFAGLERPATGDEVPALRWADISDESYGLSLLNNGKYGHQAHGTTLGLTLCRAPYEPDTLPDQGLQQFSYALYPHAGDWRSAQSDRRGASFNQPLLATTTADHAGTIQPGRAGISCSTTNVMITAVKPAESRDGSLIVRLVEMHGQACEAVLSVPICVSSAERVNILEEEPEPLTVTDGVCRLDLTPHQVATVRLRR